MERRWSSSWMENGAPMASLRILAARFLVAGAWVVRRAVALLCVFSTALPVASVQDKAEWIPLPWERTISYEWTLEPWTRDSKPYRELRERLELLSLQETRDQVAAAERAAKAKPKDPLAQFHWALLEWRAQDLAWRAQKYVVDGKEIKKALAPLRMAMASANSPSCSEYARLRFLYEVWLWPQDNHALALLAERLYEKGHRDYPLRYWRLTLLAIDAKKDLQRLGQIHLEVKRFADEFSKKPLARLMVGTVYSYKFPLTRNAEDAYAAIREEKQALAMLPPKDPLREDIQFLIDAELRRLKDWGFPPPPKT